MPVVEPPSSAAAFRPLVGDAALFTTTSGPSSFDLRWRVSPGNDSGRFMASIVFTLAVGMYASSFVQHSAAVVLAAVVVVIVMAVLRLTRRSAEMRLHLTNDTCTLSKPGLRATWTFPLADLQAIAVREQFDLRRTTWQLDFTCARNTPEGVVLAADFTSATEAAALKEAIDGARSRLLATSPADLDDLDAPASPPSC